MADRAASFYEGAHEDSHGKFIVIWKDNGWFYIDLENGITFGDEDQPFLTSFDAYDAACGYGC